MKIAVISDIHGNAVAFRQVLENMKSTGVSAVYCLGDNIGYGPEPLEVIRLLEKNKIPSVIGNHELAVNEPEFLDWFNPIARISLEKTMEFLSRQALDYIAGLPFYITEHGCRFVHGFPPDSATEYLFEISYQRLLKTLDHPSERICFVGHTHELLLVSRNGDDIAKRPMKKETITLDTDTDYIINVGSVGQPRDGNNCAKYVIFDDQSFELEVRFVPYDVNETISKIFYAGLPEQHAWRLM
ncbi:MAG: metallophosphoesterase family protein [Desulfosalsimonas sp.]